MNDALESKILNTRCDELIIAVRPRNGWVRCQTVKQIAFAREKIALGHYDWARRVLDGVAAH